MERRQLLKAAPAALLLGGAGGLVASPAAAGAAQTSVGADGPDVLNALYRWALGYDNRDDALMMSGFTDDPTFIFRSHTGAVATFRGVNGVLALFKGAQAEQDLRDDIRRHVTTNSLMERVDRRTVQVTSYLVLVSIVLVENPSLLVLTTGVYRDTVVKQGGAWRIAVRDLTLDGPSDRPLPG